MTQDEKDEIFEHLTALTEEDRKRVVEVGGLHIIGTERHESRRIDNQLRGRSGRQGDPGSSRFFLALDDELMRRFAADRVAGIMERVGMEEDMPLESKLVTRFIEGAQSRVEGYNFDIRKNVVEYDDVIAQQRKVIYADRRAVLEHSDMHERIVTMIRAEVSKLVDQHVPGNMLTEEEQLESLLAAIEIWVKVPDDILPENLHSIRSSDLKNRLGDFLVDYYDKRGDDLRKQAEENGLEKFDPLREFERSYLLQVVDRLWMDHIDALDVMRAGIGFRSIGQRDPLVEFKNEAFRMFEELKALIQHYIVDALLKLLRNDIKVTLNRPEPQRKAPRNVRTNDEDIARTSGQSKSDGDSDQSKNARKGAARNARPAATATRPSAPPKIGRNDPCPCGSGKKYKKCHGAHKA